MNLGGTVFFADLISRTLNCGAPNQAFVFCVVKFSKMIFPKATWLSGLLLGTWLAFIASSAVKSTPNLLVYRTVQPRTVMDFHFVTIKIVNGELRWEVTGEKAQGKYVVEALINSAWISEQVLPAKGSPSGSYSLKLRQAGAGNTYRIKFMAPQWKEEVSDEIVLLAGEITFYPTSVTDNLNFSQLIKYEITTPAGKVLLKGSSKMVDCRQLPAGLYHLSFNDRKEKFLKK